ncbi:unnamed protein product [Adineta steineri]|uniref:NAD(P)(+)--arginine ADP-ribosyltransferase n=1 Tax=Adineta steineri TaxID=433720 RepID=A0A819LFY7_9BILA|nr:unnamed protein product [Adineta steineri]CAF3964026.1 unnamed protein product [Adineta steineri]
MGNSNSQTTVSKFYLACDSGDIALVKQMLTPMKLKEVNRVEPNGNTGLHAAASNGHSEVVELLLKHGCSTTTTNKDGKTAAEECSHERIRQLIQSSVANIENNEQINDETLQSKWLQIYENASNEDKSVLATKIMKLRITTYLTNQFKINGANRFDHIRNIIDNNVSADNHNHELLSIYLAQAEQDESPEFLIRMYTLESPFYIYINNHQMEVFFMELLIGLVKLQNRSFCGTAYRGINMHLSDLNLYLWAYHHPTSLIEMRTFNSTTEDRSLAEVFAQSSPFSNPDKHDIISALFTIEFRKPCETALRIKDITQFAEEEEVLIVPGTFFEVTSVEKLPSDEHGATLSTFSSGVNSIATVILEDVYKRISNKHSISNKHQIFYQIFGAYAAPILGVYLLGLFSSRVKSRSVLVAFFICFIFQTVMLVGSFVTVKPVKKQGGQLPTSIAGCLPSVNITLTLTTNQT